MSSIASTAVSIGDRIHSKSSRYSWLQVSRGRAFAGHLCLSATIVGLVFAVVFLLWYPQPYFEAVGAWSIIRILVGVDLVLGPLLTLIVFKPGKRLLILDVSVIAVIQISALLYGLKVLHEERPYYAVFAIDRIEILARKDIPEFVYVQHDWMRKPLAGPILASAKRPESVEAQQRLLEETIFGGAPDIELRPEFWVPLKQDVAELASRAHPLATLRSHDDAKELLDDALARSGFDEGDLGFLPIASAKNNASALLHLETGELVDVLPVDPWAVLAQAKG